MKKRGLMNIIIMLVSAVILSACSSAPETLGFKLDKPSLNLEAGSTEKLSLIFESKNGEKPEVIWTSSDEKIASVDSTGLVKAGTAGNARIAATSRDGKITSYCAITVATKSVKGIKLNKDTLSLETGSEEKLQHAIEPAEAENQKVSWTSSDSKIASVDQNGSIKALAPGTADITVKSEEGGYLAKCKVTVKEKAASANSNPAASNTSTSKPKTGGTAKTTATIDPGNVQGNSNNYGLAAAHGGWIYYRSGQDDALLYKMRADGSQKTKVMGSSVIYINIVGDNLYYTQGATNGPHGVGACLVEPISDDNNFNHLYGMATFPIPYIYKYSKVMYYAYGDTFYTDGDGFYASKAIIRGGKDFTINSGWVYYINQYSEPGIYKARLDGSNKTMLLSGNMTALSMDNNRIYYISREDGRVYTINPDGSGNKVIGEDTAYVINVRNGWIYYANTSDGKKLYKMKIDGTGKQKLVDKAVDIINTVGDWVFYMQEQNAYGFDWSIYMIKTDGTKNQKA